MDCLFCRIVNQQIPTKLIFEDEFVLAFHDINPQAPVHVLIIPKRHIATLNDLSLADLELGGRMLIAARTVAAQLGIAADGYRTVMNCNGHGGQTVFHIHLHILGGRVLNWPPG
ncbi:MAG: histidine triad nucleotide-binding protein [Pseudomonadota bacterium]|mgnify:CR=1 FL=1